MLIASASEGKSVVRHILCSLSLRADVVTHQRCISLYIFHCQSLRVASLVIEANTLLKNKLRMEVRLSPPSYLVVLTYAP